jgi:plasmid maintenance system antidote protein VapI
MNIENNQSLNILKQLFDERKARSTNYSLRAFSRDLDISVSHLSAIMSGKSKLSTLHACQIAVKLEFHTEKFYHFVTSTLQ